LNVLTVVIYQQLHHLYHTPGVALTATALPPRPLPELPAQLLPRLLWREGQDLFDCYSRDRFDGIDKLEHEGPAALEHAHIDVLPSPRVEFYLNVLLPAAGVEEGVNAVLDLFLKTALR
jgi:hypothetical protein